MSYFVWDYELNTQDHTKFIIVPILPVLIHFSGVPLYDLTRRPAMVSATNLGYYWLLLYDAVVNEDGVD